MIKQRIESSVWRCRRLGHRTPNTYFYLQSTLRKNGEGQHPGIRTESNESLIIKWAWNLYLTCKFTPISYEEKYQSYGELKESYNPLIIHVLQEYTLLRYYSYGENYQSYGELKSSFRY